MHSRAVYPADVEIMMRGQTPTSARDTHIVCEIYPLRRFIVVREGAPIQIKRVYADGGGIIAFPQARNIAPGIYIEDRTKDMIVTKGICGVSKEGNEWLIRANAEVLKIADIIVIARGALPQPIAEEFESFFCYRKNAAAISIQE